MSPGWEARARATIARLDAADPDWRAPGILTTVLDLASALEEIDRLRAERGAVAAELRQRAAEARGRGLAPSGHYAAAFDVAVAVVERGGR